MEAKYRDVMVSEGGPQSGGEPTVSAKMVVCPQCGAEKFVAYLVGQVTHLHFLDYLANPAMHLHLQCIDCGTTCCDGSCSKGK